MKIMTRYNFNVAWKTLQLENWYIDLQCDMVSRYIQNINEIGKILCRNIDVNYYLEILRDP